MTKSAARVASGLLEATLGPDNCPFCKRLSDGDVFLQDELAAALLDQFPVSPGHMLIVPLRHEENYFGLLPSESTAIHALLAAAKELLDEKYAPDGYNIGVNSGCAAGQTVGHTHVHLIPRFKGDAGDPRGGVRWVLPERAVYWEK